MVHSILCRHLDTSEQCRIVCENSMAIPYCVVGVADVSTTKSEIALEWATNNELSTMRKTHSKCFLCWATATIECAAHFLRSISFVCVFVCVTHSRSLGLVTSHFTAALLLIRWFCFVVICYIAIQMRAMARPSLCNEIIKSFSIIHK